MAAAHATAQRRASPWRACTGQPLLPAATAASVSAAAGALHSTPSAQINGTHRRQRTRSLPSTAATTPSSAIIRVSAPEDGAAASASGPARLPTRPAAMPIATAAARGRTT